MKNLISGLILGTSSMALCAPPQDLLNELSEKYDARIDASTEHVKPSWLGYRLARIELRGEDPILQKARSIKLRVYEPFKNLPGNPSVIILPPTGGINVLDKGYANLLASRGIIAVIIEGWDHDNEVTLEMSMHDRAAHRALTAVRHTVEYLVQIRSNNIGVLGTSVGAMTGILALGYEPRIKQGVLIVGAGRFVDVIAETTEKGAARLREARMAKYGLSNLEDYRSELRKHVRTEPHDFINLSGTKRTMIITANADNTVPTAYQRELVDKMNPEFHFEISGDHVSVIQKTFFSHSTNIADFFSQ